MVQVWRIVQFGGSGAQERRIPFNELDEEGVRALLVEMTGSQAREADVSMAMVEGEAPAALLVAGNGPEAIASLWTVGQLTFVDQKLAELLGAIRTEFS